MYQSTRRHIPEDRVLHLHLLFLRNIVTYVPIYTTSHPWRPCSSFSPLIPPEHSYLCTSLHGVTSLKTVIFIFTSYSSGTFLPMYQSTRRHIPEDRVLHFHLLFLRNIVTYVPIYTASHPWRPWSSFSPLIPPEHFYLCTNLHDVTSLKTVIFIFTFVRTSNLRGNVLVCFAVSVVWRS